MSDTKGTTLIESLSIRWAGLASRERTLVAGAGVLIALALLWWVGISPALSQLRQAQKSAPSLEAQLQQMRMQAIEAASLKAQRALSYDESLRSLESTVRTLGVGATLSVNASRANITLRNVSGDALAQWLAQVRSNARLVPSEMRLKQAGAAGATPATGVSWDGSVVLNLPAR